MPLSRNPLLLCGWLVAVLLLSACAGGNRMHTLEGRSMGGTWSVKYVPAPALDHAGSAHAELEQAIHAQLDLVVAQMSTWETQSDISRFNRAAAGEWQVLPDGFFQVLDYALELAADTDGAYDPSVGALVDVWGFGAVPASAQPPGDALIQTARAQVGWQRIELDRPQQRVRQAGGMRLDLSSVAKGYAVDRVAASLHAAGIHNYLVEIGGELRAAGQRGDGSAWTVAIESPQPQDDDDAAFSAAPVQPAHTLALRDMAMATSGDYRRFFAHAGERYSHEIDPRSGYPVQGDLASVTVLHAECMHADALATALFVLGAEAGMAYARAHDLAALFVLRDGDAFRELRTPAFAGHAD